MPTKLTGNSRRTRFCRAQGDQRYILGDECVGGRQRQGRHITGTFPLLHALLRHNLPAVGHVIVGADRIGDHRLVVEYDLGILGAQGIEQRHQGIGVVLVHDVGAAQNIFGGVIVHARGQGAGISHWRTLFAEAKAQLRQLRLLLVEPVLWALLSQHRRVGKD